MLHLDFNMLPESRTWQIGRTYKLEIIVQQKSMDDSSASFEVSSAKSLNPKDKKTRTYLTDGGYHQL